MTRVWFITAGATLVAGLALIAQAADPATQPTAEHPGIHSGSRTPYIHTINLYDSTGTIINPAKSTEPYSPATTCGKCHDVEKIGHGWHFNAPDSNAQPGRTGEPWIFTDSLTRTQIPLSARNWPGTYKPESVGLTPLPFTALFGPHMPGGGVGGNIDEQTDPLAKITGKLEIDCMICHAADQSYNPVERAKQIELQNLKWVPSVAAGLATVKGEARKLPPYYDPELDLTGENQDMPVLTYDKTKFDNQNRVRFEVTRRPAAENCYFCHSTRFVGKGAPQPWHTDSDIHSRAGIRCTDCHRNGIDHAIRRGFENEAVTFETITLSCAGCHASGRLGAPKAVHKGFPPVHFEKLACTACHAGPAPQGNTLAVQTAFNHALGLSSETRTSQTPPFIVSPVFVKESDGKIAPGRLMWPMFWARGWRADSDLIQPLKPIAPSEVQDKTGSILKSAAADMPLGDATISSVLAQLGSDAVYIRDGKVYYRDGNTLTSSIEPNAAPYTWAFAHDVRPARQALGTNGCTDCHSPDAAVFFGQVTTASGVHSTPNTIPAMYALEKLDPILAKMWGLSFEIRPAFKICGLLSAGVVAVVLIMNGVAGLRQLLKLAARRSE